MSKKQPNNYPSEIRNMVFGGVGGLFLGILGNLISAWIQQDVLNNSFTPIRISLIILCTLIGVVLVALVESAKNSQTKKEKQTRRKSSNVYEKIRLFWAKLRTRGNDIHMEDVSAIGSEIDIDTK